MTHCREKKGKTQIKIHRNLISYQKYLHYNCIDGHKIDFFFLRVTKRKVLLFQTTRAALFSTQWKSKHLVFVLVEKGLYTQIMTDWFLPLL